MWSGRHASVFAIQKRRAEILHSASVTANANWLVSEPSPQRRRHQALAPGRGKGYIAAAIVGVAALLRTYQVLTCCRPPLAQAALTGCIGAAAHAAMVIATWFAAPGQLTDRTRKAG